MSGSTVDSAAFVSQVVDEATDPAKKITEAMQGMGDAADKAADQIDTANSALDATTTASTKTLPSLNQVVKALDDNANAAAKVSAAQARQAAQQAAITAAVDAGRISQDRANQLMDLAAQKAATAIDKANGVAGATKSITAAVAEANPKVEEHSGLMGGLASTFGVATYQIRNTGDELHKFIDQVVAGGSPLKAMVFQLPLIAQNLGGFGNAARGVGSILTGAGGLLLGTVAVVGGLVAMGAAAEEQESKLAQLGVTLRATRTDATAMAQEITAAGRGLAQQPGFNLATGTQAATAIGSTYDFQGSGSDIQQLATDAQNLGEVLGTGLAGGLKAVQTALTDPTAEINALAKEHFPGVTAAMVETVTRLQAAGQQGQAFATVMTAIHDQSAHAREDGLTPFQTALETFTTAAKPTVAAISSLTVSIGTTLLNAATSVLNVLSHGEQSDFRSIAQQTSMAMISGQGTMPAGLITNPTSGAMGSMQIMPANAAAYANKGIDVTTTFGNITAGVDILASAYEKAGSVNGALASYGGFVTKDPSSYISKVRSNADLSNLDPTDAAMISQAASARGVPGLANILAGVQITESGGKQFTSGSSYGGMVNQQAVTASNAANGTGGGFSATSYSAQNADITAYIANLKLQQAQQVAGSELWTETQQKIDSATGSLRNAKSAQQLVTQSMQDGLAPLLAMTGYDRALAEVTNDFTLKAKEQAGGVVDLGAENAALAIKQKELAAAFQQGTTQVQAQTQVQASLLPAYSGSAAAIQHATDYQQAYTEAQQDFAKDSPAFIDAVAKRTAALDEAASVQARQKVAQQDSGLGDQLTYLQAETSSLGQNSQARDVMLAKMQAEIAMHRQFGDVLPPEAQQYIALTGSIAQATAAYQLQQQSISDLSSGMSGIFSTLGDDISQAFTQGSGSAVSFKSILSGVETQAASLAVKFALINPAENALLGTNNTTLGSISTALGGGSSSGAASALGGGTSLLTSAGGLASLFSSSGALSGVGSFLGFGGSSAGTTVTTSVGSVDGSLGFLPSVSNTAQAGLWNGGSATAGFGSLGGALGIAGSVLPGLASGNYVQAAAGGIGAAVGTAILPGIGTALGGLAGNLLGGLFGGKKKNPYTIDTVGVSDGSLNLASSYNQAEDDKYTAQLTADIGSINTTLQGLGLSASTRTGAANLGLVGDGAGNVVSDLATMLNGLSIKGTTDTENEALSGGLSLKDYASVDSFNTAITALKTMADVVDSLHVKVSSFNADAGVVTVGGSGSFSGYSSGTASALDYGLDGKVLSTSDLSSQIATITTFVEQTMPQLLQATSTGTSSFAQSLASLTATYTNAETEAAALGINTDDLAAKLKGLTADMYSAAQTTLNYQTQGLQARDDTALGDTEGAALQQQYTSSQQERTAFDTSWQDIYGGAYQTAIGYGEASALLAKTQADEQLAIEAQYLAQRTQLVSAAGSAWTGAVANAYTAQATLADDGTAAGKTASLQYQKAGALYTFDNGYQAQVDAFTKTFTDAYGSTITQTQGFAAALQQEETTLGLQRLAIAKGYDDQITAATTAATSQAASSATSSIASLAQYASGLATSSTSPLSMADQYAAAKANEQTTAAAAQKGDPTALANLQNTLQTFLSVSQTFNNGGAGFAADYAAVQNVLGGVADLGADTLTASFYAQQQETSTETLVEALAELKAEVVALRQSQRTNALAGAAS